MKHKIFNENFCRFAETKRWTKLAIYCHSIGCSCSKCEFYPTVQNLESTNTCYIKHHVLELVRKFGTPGNQKKTVKPKKAPPRRKVRIINTGEIFANVSELAQHLHCKEKPIYMALSGYQKSVKGYKVEYVKG